MLCPVGALLADPGNALAATRTAKRASQQRALSLADSVRLWTCLQRHEIAHRDKTPHERHNRLVHCFEISLFGPPESLSPPAQRSLAAILDAACAVKDLAD